MGCIDWSLVCGILGLLLSDATQDAATEICDGLALLQHRGQDACGIVTCGAKGRFYQCKSNGMVRDVFDAQSLAQLPGAMGVGHGELFPSPNDLPLKFSSSEIPDGWFVCPRRGAAVLRQLAVRYRICPRA